MDEYIKTLLEQVRCKKAHAMIEDEIRSHMEDQIEANLANGMTEDEAVNEAVKDMGSPVESGIAFDQIHRPAVAGEMIVLMLIVSAVSIMLQVIMSGNIYDSKRFIIHTILGFGLMLLVYRLDYSFMARYAKTIGIIMLGMVFLASLGIGSRVSGGSYYAFSYGGYSFSVFAFMMLYIPLYGAILYQYYGTGILGIVKGLMWMLAPVFFAFRLSSLYLAFLLFYGMAIVLSLAVYKKWFLVSRKRFLAIFWSLIAAAPVLFLVIASKVPLLPAYQMNRIQAFLNPDKVTVAGFVSNYGSTYILTYLNTTYGVLFGSLICALLFVLVVKVFHVSFRQKNQLGMLVGCGCGTVFMMNGLANILQNFGLFPAAESWLPFFSSGGSFIIVSYILMGITMSIYRHKNVMPVHFHIKKRKRGQTV